jgi:GNAT superfamily N-acetyltransferase
MNENRMSRAATLAAAGADGRGLSLARVLDRERLLVLRMIAENATGGWFTADENETVSAYSGAGTFTANGVVLGRGEQSAESLRYLVAPFQDCGVPWGVQLGLRTAPSVLPILDTLGLVNEYRTPTMAISLGHDNAIPAGTGIRVEHAHPGDADAFAAVMAEGFEMPGTTTPPFASARLFGNPAVNAVWARTPTGQPVAVGISVTISPTIVGLFAIATPPQHRRHGYGAAVTAMLLADARARGAEIAYLQASSMGEPVYRALGFETVNELIYRF